MGLFFVMTILLFQIAASAASEIQLFLAAFAAGAFLVRLILKVKKDKSLNQLFFLQVSIFSAYFVFYVLAERSSYLYLSLARVSHFFSVFAGKMIGKPLNMGMSYSGVHLVCLFLIASTATFLFWRKKNGKKYLISLGSVLVCWGVFCMLWTVLAENSLTLRLHLLEPLTGPLDFRTLLFVLLFLCYSFIFRKQLAEAEKQPISLNQKKGLAGVCGILVVVTVCFFFPPSAPPKPEGQKNVVFWDTGISFSVPEDGLYGLDQVGMFGVIPKYLERNGYTCKVEEAITEEILKETDVLVILNPMKMPTEEELEWLWRFVKEGGSLLAVGDHTGGEQIRDPLNAILAPAKISFNFDSAIPFRSLWSEDFSMWRSPIFNQVSDRQVQMVVGASLELGFGSKPLLVGLGGFSDHGDAHNVEEGFLGDMSFNRGERVGDLILAAEARYGKGIFMVFGDTTHFQNTVLAYSYPFVDNIFAYLTENRPSRGDFTKAETDYNYSCVIDVGHLEQISRDKGNDAADGVIATALRAGYMPYVNMDPSLEKALTNREDLRAVVLMEPANRISSNEMTSINNFMENGGHVFFTGDYNSPKGTEIFAEAYGFSFENMAIGRIAPAKNSEMALWSACPLIYEGEILRSDREGIETLMDVWGYSVIAKKSVGKGSFCIIADPDFLKNKNLESSDSYRVGNIKFFKDLLIQAAEGGEVTG